MRIVICAEHILFAESLAHLLTERVKHVVAITHNLDHAAVVLRSTPADVFLLDIATGPEQTLGSLARLRAEMPQTHVILLSGTVDTALVTAGQAAGVRAIADKRQPVAEIINLLERVHAGERVPPPVPKTAAAAQQSRRYAVNDAQRLAAFLTPREREVLSALVCGDNTQEVARSLGISAATARCHIQSLLTKMGAHSRLAAATTAVRSGMISPETGQWLTPAS